MMKFTKKVALEVAINAIANSAIKEYHFAGSEETFSAEEVTAKLMGMMEQLEAKSNAPKKPTKVQEANEGVKGAIKVALEGQSPKTVSEIQTLSPELAALSNQKVASLVRQMVEAGVLVRTEEKRKAYFSLAQG